VPSALGVPTGSAGTEGRRRLLQGRVAQRMFWLFVLAALLPLLVSGWLANTAINQVAQDAQGNAQGAATRMISLQVYDRLVGAKTLLATLPRIAAASPDRPAIALPGNVNQFFTQLVHVDAAGQVDWPPGASDDLPGAWRLADHGGEGQAPQALVPEHGSVATRLRIMVQGQQAPRLLMSTAVEGSAGWIGELRPGYLWEPVAEAAIDSGWRVLDAAGRSLADHGEPSLLPPMEPRTQQASDSQRLFQTSLPLGGPFGASAWEFIEQRQLPVPRLGVFPLAVWLGLVGLATVLLVALVSQRAIGRMLVPLEQLTAGTQRLAAGAIETRVAVHAKDEFGTLGRAFNEMAARIEAQFGSLEGLAAVDRDVLSGRPIELVAARVLDQLARQHPALRSAVSWLEVGSGRLSQLARASGIRAEVVLSQHPLAPELADRMASIWSDQQQPRRSPDAAMPWCEAACDDDTRELMLLPLRWADQTQALLVLGSPGGWPEGIQKSAGELRDRLSVAFAARQRERLMAHRAVHDSLTGLANRAGLAEFIDQLLAREGDQHHAVLFVDLDHFKDANDSLGHQAGDAILCETAHRLAAVAPPDALIARQGGDEFVIVQPQVNEAAVSTLAQRVVEVLGKPYLVDGEEYRFGGSVGIARYPMHGLDRDTLMRQADLAMYSSKESGRSRWAMFDTALETAAQERVRVPRELRRDLDLGKLVAHYQPRVRPSDGCITSMEALVRWQHPERGLLMPGAFITLAEESNLIEDLGTWMINEACARMVRWRRQHPSLMRVSVNVSPRQLSSGRLPQVVRTALDMHGLPAQYLELEVTESLLVSDSGAAYGQLAELRDWGVCIALDDFGTGFSSMSMLRKLPIDVMKIDRAFVKDLGQDEAALAITRSIAELAHSLGLHIVAEGIETPLQASLLGALGCHEFQGYLYSKPLPPAEFSRLCSESGGWMEPPSSGFVPLQGFNPISSYAPLEAGLTTR
jgi:diguanylate cyclase (GGDEF)-like protein